MLPASLSTATTRACGGGGGGGGGGGALTLLRRKQATTTNMVALTSKSMASSSFLAPRRRRSRALSSLLLPSALGKGPSFGEEEEPSKESIEMRKGKSPKGASFEADNRRRGRPAWRRSPDDSPLRDGNRDRLVGLLTQRATRTLATYLSEMNLNHYHWLIAYERSHEIPRDGAWEDVSGQTFLRTLLSMPIGEAKYDVGRPDMYDHVKGMGIDPRSIAQRIMDIRSQLAREWAEDLSDVSEENALLLRESASASLRKAVAEHPFDSSADEESGSDREEEGGGGGRKGGKKGGGGGS